MPGTAALYVRSTPEGIRRFESARFKKIPRTRPKELSSRRSTAALSWLSVPMESACQGFQKGYRA